MSILEDIQQDAVDGKVDVSILLRKCKLLAARLGSKELEDWVTHESNGYPLDISVPEYRIWPLELKGHFSGPFGSGINNAPIPLACLPVKVRADYQRYKCRQSIASIEDILRKSKDGKGTLSVAVGDLALVIGQTVYKHQNCVEAWAQFGSGQLVELVNCVRNKVLDFSLAIWKQAPNAGQGPTAKESAIPAAQVTQIFQTTIYGGSASIVGTAEQVAVSFGITPKDFKSLAKALQENGIPDPEIEELKEIISVEPEAIDGKVGPKVAAWMGKIFQKAADGTVGIGVGAAGNLLSQVIAKFYGLG